MAWDSQSKQRGTPLSKRAFSQMKMRHSVQKSACAIRARTKKGGNAQYPQEGIAQVSLPKFPFYSLVEMNRIAKRKTLW